ncbi:IclR family transcriptional regulator [Martelella soudanensis]|uniref:IclR family transcriptional regulator n=1 Tax=unclassified Martelella TaxID=2629616 RepID=UPI0015DF233C|nr:MULTISPECIES: IclR family transcriptional regulator [unclassified Martelella]
MLRLLAGSPPDGVKLVDIAAELGLPHPTAHRILKALEEEGVVERVRGTRRYTIGSEAAWLGLPAANRFPISQAAAPALDRLCEAVGDSVFLAVRSRNDSVYVDRRIGSYPVQARRLTLGARRPLGVSIASRAIMAYLPKEKTADILMENERRYVDYRLTPDRIIEDLATARSQGFLLASSLTNIERRVLSVPVFDIVGAPVAAISVIASMQRLQNDRVERILPKLKLAASAISERLLESNTLARAC